jgi:hypothetical protein
MCSMIADRTFIQSPAVVLIGFLDGQIQMGSLSKSSPSVTDLTLTLINGSTPKATYPAERITMSGSSAGWTIRRPFPPGAAR